MGTCREVESYARLALDVVATDGCELLLRDGRRVLDLYGGHCVNTLGGSSTVVERAILAQWERVSFVTNLLDHAPRHEFLAAFGALLPDGDWRVFLSNSGAEANECALKASLSATGRRAVVCFAGAFHGRTAAAAAVSDKASMQFPSAPFEVRRLPWGELDRARRALAAEDVGAVILEPIQSLAGIVCPPPEFLVGLRELTRETGTALVFDEVQTASGRTGAPFAAQTFGVTPDVLTTAKGAAGGLPIGITAFTAELAARFRGDLLGSTFGGGPTVMGAATAVARAVAEDDFQANVRAASEAFRAAALRGPIESVRGEGLLLGLVVRAGITAKSVRDALLARNVLVGTSDDPRVLRLSPPLVVKPEDAQRLARALEDLSLDGVAR